MTVSGGAAAEAKAAATEVAEPPLVVEHVAKS